MEARPYRLIEIPFKELEAAPLEVMQKVYRKFGWDWFSEAKPKMQTYLNDMQGFKKNQHAPITDAVR